ncbi:MAG: DUF4271 domain-containing protein [Bacteroidia bacterium]
MPEIIKQHTNSTKTTEAVIDSALDSNNTHYSLFENHLLKTQNLDSQLHKTHYDFFIGGLLLLVYTLFVWLYVSNRKKLNQLIQAFYLNRSTEQLSKDDLAIGNRVAVFLSLFFIINSTLFGIHLLSYYQIGAFFHNNTAISALLIALIIVFTYSLKFLTIRILGNIFSVQKEAAEYAMLVFLFCNILGLFMLPIVLALSFMKQVNPTFFIYSGLALIAIFVMIRTLRGLFIGMNSTRISKIYLFVYLCTLELLPVIVLVKLFLLKLNQ